MKKINEQNTNNHYGHIEATNISLGARNADRFFLLLNKIDVEED